MHNEKIELGMKARFHPQFYFLYYIWRKPSNEKSRRLFEVGIALPPEWPLSHSNPPVPNYQGKPQAFPPHHQSIQRSIPF